MLFAFLTAIILFFFPTQIYAIYDPLSVPNNRFGIHIADPNDISETNTLVNSSQGDWGYITVVIQDNDLNHDKWQEFFNIMRRKHIIPIVRLATHPTGDAWSVPQEVDVDKWVNFLKNLTWPITNQYVVLFNEPNHAKEWGNIIDPEGYGKLLIMFSQKLKNASDNFFILPAGLDASASTDGEALDETEYIRRMVQANPDVFSYIDGWTSHSYPNPSFSGNPYASGRGTLRTFAWEKDLLLQLGMTKELPVFITETGWQHSEGKYKDRRMLTPDTVSEYFQIAANDVWTNQQIVAITPFVYNYQDNPFDHFSWKKLQSSDFYVMYTVYQNILKTAGKPKQDEIFTTDYSLFPDSLVTNSTYTLETTLTNRGQGILLPNDGYTIDVVDPSKQFSFFADTVPLLEPNEKGPIKTMVKTPNKEGQYMLSLGIKHGDTRIPIENKMVTLIPPPSATIHVTLGWSKGGNVTGATVLVYDKDETLLHKFTDIPIDHGMLTITGLYQVIPGKPYRIVVLAPYYLPRQTIVTMQKDGNAWTLKRMYPFDFNKDGKLSIADIFALVKLKPLFVLRMLMGQ